MDEDDFPMDTSGRVLYFTKEGPAYAGYDVHEDSNAPHTHTFVEIAFIVGGAGTHHCVAGRRELSPGDVFLLRSGVWHRYEDCRHLELYNCCFSSELLRRELSWTREDPLLGYLLWSGPYGTPGRGVLAFHLPPAALAECLEHLRALASLGYCPSPRYRGDMLGRLSLLFGALGRAARPDPARADAEPLHPAVGKAVRMLEAAIDRQWTLTELAEKLHLAPSYLIRLFKAATGLPPMAYLAQVRAEHAAVMLLHSDEPVTVIAHAVGWTDQNYFARRFKAHYGVSPTAYRARFATQAMHLHEPSGGRDRGSAGRDVLALSR